MELLQTVSDFDNQKLPISFIQLIVCVYFAILLLLYKMQGQQGSSMQCSVWPLPLRF